MALLLLAGVLGCKSGGSTAPQPAQPASAAAQPGAAGGSAAGAVASPALPPSASALEARLAELAARAGGQVGIALLHVESGWSAGVGAERWQPLQSVYKLPLAVAVARAVHAGRVRWEQSVTVTEADRVPGSLLNQELWQQLPRTLSVRELLAYSLVNSDNISSAKLVSLIGGRGALVEQLRALGFTQRAEPEGLPYHGQAAPLVHLLAGLQRGDVLPAEPRAVLWELLARSRTGERRIRAGAPSGALVLEKTGTGREGSVTNDVGLITLPGGAGHLALAVLIAGSSLPGGAQEALIAEVTREACAAFGAGG